MNYFFLLAAALCLSSSASRVRFDRDQVIQLPREALKTAKQLHLDVWAVDANGVNLRVNPTELRKVKQIYGSKVKVVVNNVQELVDAEQAEPQEDAQPTKKTDWHTAYHSYDEIRGWMKQLASNNPKIVSYVNSIGKTVEGRDIPLIKITGTKAGDKKRVWVQAMQHAREWIAGSSAQYIADQLVARYSSDSTVTKLLDQVEVIIIPMCNPDGYEYSRTNNRMWRKNRGEQYGVDINRNWPDHWNTAGTDDDPESETYAGVGPATAPEIQALIKYFKSTPNILAAVDLHSFSQVILRPYGYQEKENPDSANFIKLGDQIVQDYAKSGTRYVSQRGIDLYPTSGTARDWFYGNSTAVGEQKKYGITIELSPTSSREGGFVLPPSKIIPIGKDTTEAILSVIKHVLVAPLGIKTASEA